MDEYIKREAVIDLITRRYENPEICTQEINSIPAADVVPVVHGRWEQCFEGWRKQIEGDQCSVCGFAHYGTTIRDYNYCPNCGAKMDGGADNA